MSSKTHFPNNTGSTPGSQFELRDNDIPNTAPDYTPDPSNSLSLEPKRQSLVKDIIALYSCEPTVERVKRYSPDCVYDDQFGYAGDRYRVAGQWFALPKLFKDSKNAGYQVVTNDRDLIQFRNEQIWTFRLLPKSVTMKTLISLSLDPSTIDSDFIQVKYHKDQGNEKDYSHEGLGFSFKKWQAENVVKNLDMKEIEQFAGDKRDGSETKK